MKYFHTYSLRNHVLYTVGILQYCYVLPSYGHRTPEVHSADKSGHWPKVEYNTGTPALGVPYHSVQGYEY